LKSLKLTPLVPTETQEQSALIQWWAMYAASRKIDQRLLLSIPNGAVLAGDARRRAMQMARLKREGLRPGVPDLMLAIPRVERHGRDANGWPVTIFNGLFVEMKRIGGKPTKDQLEMADLLRRQGYNVVIAEGYDEARRAIEGYLRDYDTPRSTAATIAALPSRLIGPDQAIDFSWIGK